VCLPSSRGLSCFACGVGLSKRMGQKVSTHRRAWGTGGTLAAFQSKSSLQSSEMWVRHPKATHHPSPLAWLLTHHWTREPSIPREAPQSWRAIFPGETGRTWVTLKTEVEVNGSGVTDCWPLPAPEGMRSASLGAGAGLSLPRAPGDRAVLGQASPGPLGLQRNSLAFVCFGLVWVWF
jgi:hypothetical protein